MILHILCFSFHAPQPSSPVLHQQLLNEVLGHLVHVLRPLYPTSKNLLINDKSIVITERRISCQHLIDEDPQCPPVHSLVVALGLDDLWSQVLWCPTQGPGLPHNFLGEPKVCDDYVAILAQEDVLWLEVSVDDIEGVEIGESTDNLSTVEEGHSRGEGSSHSEIDKKFSTRDIREHQVEIHIIFATPCQREKEGVLDFLQDGLLILHMVYIVELHDVVDWHDLQCIV